MSDWQWWEIALMAGAVVLCAFSLGSALAERSARKQVEAILRKDRRNA